MKTNALQSILPFRTLPAILLLTMSLWSCQLFDKDKDPQPTPVEKPDEKPDKKHDDKPEPGPVNKVPTEIVGKWRKGFFNMTRFFTYDGKDQGPGY